ncbi:hypothetical protein [Lentzea sp. CC55]|uniref:hypothetical protein n=1 Tax=Lentzea sp. CC55 TaxID=2884909 RepID=UPI001F371B2F|nr:hypothetical protein [Lentzea sp. CC55]MCG8924852.1 hypothetical protein [Lentzea sp. CC55]
MNEQPYPYTVLAMDTVASSAGTRARQVHLDKALDRVIAGALHQCSFADDKWFHRVTGDSATLAAPASVPKARIAADFVRELGTALHNVNSMMNETGRLRVRLAIDHGDVIRHSDHINGTAVVRAARLCDSEALRDALRRNSDVDLAVIVTEAFYDDAVVEGDRGVDPREFTFVHDRVKGREVSGWIWLPSRQNKGGNGGAPRLGPRPVPVPPSDNSTKVRDVKAKGNIVIGTNGSMHNHYPDNQ